MGWPAERPHLEWRHVPSSPRSAPSSKRGLAGGIVPNGDRAAILINLPVAQAVGMDLDPKLLELAEVIR